MANSDEYGRVIKIADRLGLGVWTIKLIEKSEETSEDEDYAEVNFRAPMCEATITLYKEYYAADDFTKVRVLVHELLHCVFAPVDEVIETLPDIAEELVEVLQKVDPHNDDAARAVIAFFCEEVLRNYNQRAERVIDAVSCVMTQINDLGLMR